MSYVQKFSKNGVVKWNAAPEGVQYYLPESDENYEGFFRVEDGALYGVLAESLYEDSKWKQVFNDLDEFLAEPALVTR